MGWSGAEAEHLTVDVDIDKLELCTGPCRVMMMELGGIMKTENTSHWHGRWRAGLRGLRLEIQLPAGGGGGGGV